MRRSKSAAMLFPALLAVTLFTATSRAEEPATTKGLATQIFETMTQVHGVAPHFRLVHAKGIVCDGKFEPTKDAAAFSKAPQFQGPAVPLTVRFSDGSPEPLIPDNAPNAGPRGLAIRFSPTGGEETDIVAMSHNGFVVSTGEEFLALQKSVVATDPTKPHPWPVEEFLGAHPLALKFVKENAIIPESFATEAFFSNNSFTFVNKEGKKQIARYKILPVLPLTHLTEAQAKEKSPNFLIDDLTKRLATAPVQYKLIAQLPSEGDSTKDPAQVWPDDRKTIELGTLSITAVTPNSSEAEKALAFDPANLASGIELSDDPFPELRSKVYALARKHRNKK